MTVKNHRLKDMRLSQEMDAELSEIAEALGMNKTDLARMLLNRGLRQLRADAQRAGGLNYLEFTFRNE